MITLQEQVDRSTSHELVAVALVALFGGLALLLTRLLGNLLYHVSPRDPLAFAAAFAVTSFAACFLPTWRETRIDPIRALRAP